MTPSGFSRQLHAGDEVVEVGHLRQHVVADDEVGLLALGGQLLRRASRRRTRTSVGTPLLDAPTSATLAAGSMPSTGTPARHEVLQQVAVVAGELDDEAVGARGRSRSLIISQ